MMFGCSKKTIDTSYLADYTENPQITNDGKLLVKGDEKQSNKGRVEVIQANFTTKTTMIGPMKVQFFDTKELLVAPDVSMIDYFHELTDEENFHILKAFVSVENTSTEAVQFNPSAGATASSGETWTWQQEVFLDELNGLYEPGQVKKGNIGYILTQDTPPAAFTIESSDVFDLEQDIVSAGAQIKLTLK